MSYLSKTSKIQSVGQSYPPFVHFSIKTPREVYKTEKDNPDNFVLDSDGNKILASIKLRVGESVGGLFDGFTLKIDAQNKEQAYIRLLDVQHLASPDAKAPTPLTLSDGKVIPEVVFTVKTTTDAGTENPLFSQVKKMNKYGYYWFTGASKKDTGKGNPTILVDISKDEELSKDIESDENL